VHLKRAATDGSRVDDGLAAGKRIRFDGAGQSDRGERLCRVRGKQPVVANRCVGDRTGWLPFLDTYRTMCRAPEPAFRQILEDVRGLRFAA